MKNNLICILYLLVTGFFACSKKSATNFLTPPPGNPNIYATGFQDSQGVVILRYWKNGIPFTLPNHANLIDVSSLSTTGIAVSGDDVYVSGDDFNELTKHSAATYWKNETPFALGDPNYDTYATAIAVSGIDVYVSGYEYRYDLNTNTGNSSALYWKNGVPVILGDTISYSYAESIAVSGKDVYVAGIWSAGPNAPSIAVFWKNGTKTVLTDTTVTETAILMIGSGTDIYPAWAEYNNMGLVQYGNNGMAIPLQTVPGLSSAVTSMTVSGNDLYASGNNFNNGYIGGSDYNAVYWKNGNQTILTKSTANSYNITSSIAVSGSDVYVGGSENSMGGIGIIWKNGVPAVLPKSTQISSICLSNP